MQARTEAEQLRIDVRLCPGTLDAGVFPGPANAGLEEVAMERRQFVVVLTAGVLAAATAAVAQGPGTTPPATRPRWGQQAEKEFRMGRGLGPQLMTEEEWKEHQEKMRTMTPQEREKYREEVHQKMLERAKEKGITMPPAPRGRRGPTS